MALHPQVQAVLEERAARAVALPAPAPGTEPGAAQAALLEHLRREYEETTTELCGPPPPVAWARERTIHAPEGRIPVRVYAPDGEPSAGAVVYMHGGGWILGSPATHDAVCRALANASGAVVVNVDYRRAPEHPFPAAVHDAEAALRWTHEHANELGAEPDRLAVAGDSAGANLATVIARRARDAGGPPVRFQLLVYPALDRAMDTPSYDVFAEGYGLTRAEMSGCWDLYLAGADGDSPDASPLRGPDLAGLPPALVITAEYDPLRDEGERYAERLREAGVPVSLSRYGGMSHGFFRWLAKVDAAGEAVREAGAALREALGTPVAAG
jgi:acetyl esterase